MADKEDIQDEIPQKKPKKDLPTKKQRKKKRKKANTKKTRRLKLIRELYLDYARSNNIKLTRNWFAEVANIYKSVPIGLKYPIVEKRFAAYFNQYSKNPNADPEKVIEDELGDIEITKDAEPKFDYIPFFPWFSINVDPRNSIFFTSVAKEVIFICGGEFGSVNILVPMDEYDTFCANAINYCRNNGYNDSPIIELTLVDMIIENNIQSIPVYDFPFDNRMNDYADYEVEFGGFSSTNKYKEAFENGNTQQTWVANRQKRDKEAKEGKGKMSTEEEEQPEPEPEKKIEEKIETKIDKEAQKIEIQKQKLEIQKEKLKIEKQKAKTQKEKFKIESKKIELQKLKELNKLVAQLAKAGLPPSEIQSIVKKFK